MVLRFDSGLMMLMQRRYFAAFCQYVCRIIISKSSRYHIPNAIINVL